MRRTLAVLALAAPLAACSTGPSYNLYADNPKATMGTLLGGAGGGLLGASLGKDASGDRGYVYTAVGTQLGAMIGNSIGSSLDEMDQQYAGYAATDALEYNRPGTPASWRNPDSGNHGYTMPTRTYRQGGAT